MDKLTLLGVFAAVGLVCFVVSVIADAYRRFRGTKAVICPETNAPAEIVLNAARATAAAALGRRDLRVVHCSRRHERHYCGHDCLVQVP